MHSLRNSPPDCFSQMLMHLEPRVSCTACNSLIAPYKIQFNKSIKEPVGADTIRPPNNPSTTCGGPPPNRCPHRAVIPPSTPYGVATSLYKGGKSVSIPLSPLQRGKRRSRRGIGRRQLQKCTISWWSRSLPYSSRNRASHSYHRFSRSYRCSPAHNTSSWQPACSHS